MSLQVGKITKYDGKSNRIWLEPVSDFPFDFRKKTDDDDGVSPAQSDPSPYQEDGSLEVGSVTPFCFFFLLIGAYLMWDNS